MKNIIFTFFLAATSLLCSNAASGQDLHFSQLAETPLLRNPALAGLFSGDVRLQTVYRSQWNNITDAYQTGSANMEFKIPVGPQNDFATIGAQVLYDRAGSAALTATHILPVINYHKSLSDDRNMYLSMAAMGGYVQRRFDRSKITTNSQYNGSGYLAGSSDGETFRNSSYSYFDATVGMSFNTQLGNRTDDNMYVGLSYHHLNKPKNISFYSDYDLELAPKWVASLGLRTALDDYSYLTIEGDYNKQTVYSSTILGAIYTKKLDDADNPKYLIHAGGYYRLNDAFIPMIKLEARPVAIAVSYDANMSALKRVTNGRGGFELSLSYQAFNNRDNSSIEATRCPKF